MNRKLRRDRNAFLVYLAVVTVSLLVALPLATSYGNLYMAAKAQQMQSGSGGTSDGK